MITNKIGIFLTGGISIKNKKNYRLAVVLFQNVGLLIRDCPSSLIIQNNHPGFAQWFLPTIFQSPRDRDV
jgi:hypothetical protein